ncbi:extracellular solute-binding protein [Streptosporangium sp. V21-05]|uniref:extracellular solute-binding protein n=1 Tax=Streptosporangium sp. V21-05 TaxID=3446115 RepID=UPI003F52AA05
MITRSKRVAIPATALALGAGLAACGSEEPSGSSGGKITFTFWDDNGGPARTPVWRHVIAEFHKANPAIEVRYVGIPIAQAQQKYDTAIAGGGLPDVGGVSTAMPSSLVAQKALEPVDTRISGGALNGVLNEQVLATVKSTVPDGKTYLVPISTNMDVFWYRTDWFKPEFNAIAKTDMEPEFQKVLRGGLAPKDFLDTFAARLTEAQASYRQRNGG